MRLGVTTLGLSLYENIALVVCLILYIGSIIVYMGRNFSQERKLEQSEITAELDMLNDKMNKKAKKES
ncbi:DUF3966 domain-containing protein [Bacillus sp. WLY-B-L8]|uniref:DUF3966 domain-containing protein n=1 Tax=Bacillus multifaciens TaxID=3068506 RepID=UPI0027414670|nr:DUF3966 domain-containing protein [Bacillus sp. WLY-B-L8]MDP7977179.1 DUF3966 domain-containing protein [Bacillus sp. WLY-B-L8]HDX9587744.1 DUF3966 domain-containing protein [Bacillus pseudomycoides]